MKASLGALIVNVAVIHGAGLVLLSQQQASPTTAHSAQPAKVMHLRLAQADVGHAAQVSTPSQTGPQPGAAPVTDLREEPTSPDMAQAPIAPPEQTPPQEAARTTAPSLQADTEEYIPRPRLSEVPIPTAPVMVPFPPEVNERVRHTAILALFIDETGLVRRVRIDGPALPKPFEDAARSSFLLAHFSPGKLQGREVKSLIRIEVVFDNLPVEASVTHNTL
jgi:hypothetical protein